MSQLVFPVLQGLTWEMKLAPTFSSVVQRSKNRARTALVNDPYPLWTFELTYEFLRGPGFQGVRPSVHSPGNPEGYSELEQIVGLYLQMQGGAGDFLLDPSTLSRRPQDNTVRGASIGTGDGSTTEFYLQRQVGGFLDEVQDPIAGTVFVSVGGAAFPASVAVSGSTTVNWTLGTAGQIVFTNPPAAGAAIAADFRFQWRCCFAEDSLGLDGLMYQLYELKSLKLEQVKR